MYVPIDIKLSRQKKREGENKSRIKIYLPVSTINRSFLLGLLWYPPYIKSCSVWSAVAACPNLGTALLLVPPLSLRCDQG